MLFAGLNKEDLRWRKADEMCSLNQSKTELAPGHKLLDQNGRAELLEKVRDPPLKLREAGDDAVLVDPDAGILR